MQFLGFLVIGIVMTILVLPFVALAKADRAKRGVADLARRVASLENELRNLRPQEVSRVQPEATPAVSKRTPEPPPIPQELLSPNAPQLAKATKAPINWEQFMGAKLFAWIGGFAL